MSYQLCNHLLRILFTSFVFHLVATSLNSSCVRRSIVVGVVDVVMVGRFRLIQSLTFTFECINMLKSDCSHSFQCMVDMK